MKFRQTPIIEKSVLVNPEICNKAWRERIVTLPDLTTPSIRVEDCLRVGCLQGGDKEFKHWGEAYSLNHLLREAEDGLENAVNPFSKLRDAWNSYAAVILIFLLIQYVIIRVMCVQGL